MLFSPLLTSLFSNTPPRQRISGKRGSVQKIFSPKKTLGVAEPAGFLRRRKNLYSVGEHVAVALCFFVDLSRFGVDLESARKFLLRKIIFALFKAHPAAFQFVPLD